VGNNISSNNNRSASAADENAVNCSGVGVSLRSRRIYRSSNNELVMDGRWLDACCGAVDGNVKAVEAFLSSGGDPTRQLSESEVAFLNRPSAFDIGLTLIHLALR
jgi:hypothetical protein